MGLYAPGTLNILFVLSFLTTNLYSNTDKELYKKIDLFGEVLDKIRKEYAKIPEYSKTPGCPGNIIHSSDSFEECDIELKLLFNENITNFKDIGTYYKYHE